MIKEKIAELQAEIDYLEFELSCVIDERDDLEGEVILLKDLLREKRSVEALNGR